MRFLLSWLNCYCIPMVISLQFAYFLTAFNGCKGLKLLESDKNLDESCFS